MTSIAPHTERPDWRQFWRHAGGLSVLGVIVALALGAAFMSIGHDQRPRAVPVAAVAPPAAARVLEARSRGALDVRAVDSRAAAERAIAARDVYGAVAGRELLVASAANNGVANLLRRTLGAQATRVTDVRPLPTEDATGADVALLLQVLLLGGSIAVAGIGRLLPRMEGDPPHGIVPITFLAGYALLSGLALTLIAGAFDVGSTAPFVDRVLAMALISGAVAGAAAALVALIGPAGSAVAGVLFFVLGAQISGAGAAPELLPPFWSTLGHYLPGGAGTTLLRDVLYFPDAATGDPVAILAAYAGAGLLVVVALSLLRAGRRQGWPASPPGTLVFVE
jgi:hypothetical protein